MDNEEVDFEKLERANPIIQVATELGIRVQGGMGACFRKERHAQAGRKPTLFFNPAKNRFHCRDCSDVGGTVVDLVCQHQGWDRERAIEWLAHRAEFDRFTHGLYHGKGRKRRQLNHGDDGNDAGKG